MHTNTINFILPSIKEKLCLSEIKHLLEKEEKSIKKSTLIFSDLVNSRQDQLLAIYHNHYGINSEFLFRDLRKLFLLVQNYKFNMYENDVLNCFFEQNHELREFMNEGDKGIKSILCKLNDKSSEKRICEDLLVNFIR